MLDILVANLTKNFIPIFFLSSYLSCGHIIIDATSCATVTPSLSAFTLPFCHVLLTYFISENYVKTSISTFLSKTTAHNFPHFLFLFRITYIFLMLSARSLIPAAAWSRYISANIFPLLISIYILLVKTQLQIFFSFFFNAWQWNFEWLMIHNYWMVTYMYLATGSYKKKVSNTCLSDCIRLGTYGTATRIHIIVIERRDKRSHW